MNGHKLPDGHAQTLFRAAERGNYLIRDYLNCRAGFIYRYSVT